MKFIAYLFIGFTAILSSCQNNSSTFKVAATAVPHVQMLEEARDELASQGINLEIITVEDYQIPNRALADGEIHANFFQHIPFLQMQIAQFNYPLEIADKIHIEPMGAYSLKIQKIEDLKDNSIVSIPNDPSNEARALLLLCKAHLISLKETTQPTILDIVDNDKQLSFQEIDSAMLPRTLQDVDLALIPTNFALQANLQPGKDSLLLEDSSSPYVNIVAVRKGDTTRADVIALTQILKCSKMKKFVNTKYKGAIQTLD